MGCIANFSVPERDGGAVLDGVSIPERSGAQDEGQRAAFNRLALCLVPAFRAEAAGHVRAFIA